MNNRPLIIFLLANFVIGLFIIVDFKNKSGDNKVATKNEPISTNVEEIKTEKIVTPMVAINTRAPEPIAPTISIAENTVKSNVNEPAICMEYGPLDIEQKSIFDAIVIKEKIKPSVKVSQKNQYEIYWNLGNNQVQANEMFERQKRDVLQDKKFKLIEENGIWVVSIAIVNDNIETAKALAIQLSEKAGKVNAGGKWQYRTLPNAYYYQVKNINEMTAKSQAQITTGMGVAKKPCLI